jgi:hypothetical protein
MPNETNANSVTIDANTNLTATVVRDRIATAIDSARTSKGLRLDTSDLQTTGLLIFNLRASAIGNQPISSTGLNSNFFLSSAMTGGLAGDCAAGVGCVSNQDCLSSGTGVGSCSSGVCVTN